jgi:hypothetical protein
MTMLRHAGKVTAGALSAALVARLGLPALGALVFLAVLVAGVVCWVLSDDARAECVTRILSAWHEAIRSPEPDTPVISPPGSHRRLRGLQKR